MTRTQPLPFAHSCPVAAFPLRLHNRAVGQRLTSPRTAQTCSCCPQSTSRGVPFLRPTTAAASPRPLSHHLTWFVPASPSRCSFEASRQGGRAARPGTAEHRPPAKIPQSDPSQVTHSFPLPALSPRDQQSGCCMSTFSVGEENLTATRVLSPIKCRYELMS